MTVDSENRRCECGKVPYATPADALRAMMEINEGAGEDQLRLRGMYRCDGFGPVHLTSGRWGDRALMALAISEVRGDNDEDDD